MNYTVLYCSQEIPAARPGTMFLLMAAGMAFSRLAAGKAFDRTGPGKSMALSFACILCGLSLKAFFRDPLTFYAFGLLMGVGCGIAVPVCQAMINFLAPVERRGAANATCMTAFDAGVCLAILVIGHTQKAFGWPVSHAIEFAFILTAIVWFWGVALPHYSRSPHPGGTVETAVTRR